MEPDLDDLETYLVERDLDGYLIDAPGADPDQQYLSGFDAPDPFLSLFVDGHVHLLVRGLERALAREESRAATVASPQEIAERTSDVGADPRIHDVDVIVAFLDEHDVDRVAVPPRFPVGEADGLRELGVTIESDDEGIIERIRAVKTPEEIDYIRHAQAATEEAMGTAEGMLAEASIRDGTLFLDGEPLTSERIKTAVRIQLLRAGYMLEEVIVAGGSDAAKPHDRGSGPLPAHAPIVIDIFPRDTERYYHGDMTRTFCVGPPDSVATEWYDLTDRAYRAALETIEPGVSTKAVHAAACEVYEEAGLPTNRSHPGTETGFVHGTGHGVGLAVHERPRVSLSGETIRPGQVFSVEPGLYDPDVGGIRIEDLVVVTEDGYENLNTYGRTFVV